ERLPAPERLAQRREDERHGDDRDRYVEPEDRLPAQALDDGAPDERAERDTEAGDASPDPDRERAPRGRDRADEQRERQGEDRGGAGALGGAGGDERTGGVRERGRGRGEREERDPADEHPAAAEAVAERRRGQHEGRERERVRVLELLELLDAPPSRLRDHVARLVADEGGERRHEQRNGACDGSEG